MFDTHSHIQFKIFDQTRDQIIAEAKNAGVEKIISVGTNLESSKKAVEISLKYPEVYASVGIHPHHVFDFLKESSAVSRQPACRTGRLSDIEKMIKHHNVVAVGETGMDRHIYKSTKYPNYLISKEFIELQKIFFAEQIKLAIKYNKALIIHNREAVKETLEVLEKNWDKILERKSVFHMCEPDERLLKFAKKHNVFISFGGDITYDKKKQEFLKKVPLELLVLETDSPFFVPRVIPENIVSQESKTMDPGSSKSGMTNKEDDKINEPANLKYVSQKVAEVMNVDIKKVEEQTYENARKLFNL